MKKWQAVLLAVLGICLSACTASPTGRSQLILFSNQQMSSLGSQSFEQMKREQKVNTDARVNAYVSCVANAITPHVPKSAGIANWEVVVFDSEQVNAFALPGGKIGVFTGLLKVAENQHQLATVIGHEIAHVLANHSNERMSQAQLANAGLQITNAAMNNSDYKGITMAALGLGVQYGVLLPYGRTQESEADSMGLQLMAQAGFNPRESVALWLNMAKASRGQQQPELLSTHPSHRTRIIDLKAGIQMLPKQPAFAPNCHL